MLYIIGMQKYQVNNNLIDSR